MFLKDYQDQSYFFRRFRALILAVLLIAAAVMELSAEIPDGYYNEASGLTGEELRNALHEIIDDHTRLSYSGDTFEVVAEADEDPNNPDNILDIYKNASYPKDLRQNKDKQWSREHAWPKSYGFADNSSDNYPFSDCHHLFACDGGYNSARSNTPYDNCTTYTKQYPVEDYPELFNLRAGSGPDGSWEVWDHKKGDAARALLYMDVRYEGGTHGTSGAAEPDLILTDNRELIVSSDKNLSIAYMGIFSVLLEWHSVDPVDDRERRRNDVVYSHQGNRNPFIDHPEWVYEIWGGETPTPTSTPTPTATATGTPTPTATPILGIAPGDIVINEIDYDDPGADSHSFIELKNISGKTSDLSELEIVGVSNGTTEYFSFRPESRSLSAGEYHVFATTDDSDDVSTPDEIMSGVSSIQNGPDDGIHLRLYEDSNIIIDSVSYEGDAAHPDNSPDSGDAGTDAPDDSTAVYMSLSRVPDGEDSNNNSNDFSWKEATPGEMNSSVTPTPTATPSPTVTATPTPTATPAGEIQPGDIVINEIDYDSPGADTESFVELKNVSAKTLELSLIELVGLTGGSADVYFIHALTSYSLSPGEYYVLGTADDSTSVTQHIDEIMSGTGSIQNGPDDGLFLRLAASPEVIIDSVSYEGEEAHPAGSPDAGNAGTDTGNEAGKSLSRIPDGTDTNSNPSDFTYKESTPGENNSAQPPPSGKSGILMR